jgi:predicted DNA-binding transcriptional regulator AlpA
MHNTIHAKNLAGEVRPESRSRRRNRIALKRGTNVIWPAGLQERYGISAPTRWRWERIGRIPPRDVHLKNGKSGWRPETIEAAEQQQSS